MAGKISRPLQRGFTLIETMIAIAVLAFGLLSLVAVYSQGILYRASSQADLVAKEKAAEAIESIFTARDTSILTWAQIRNVSAGGGAVFLDGARPLLDPGPDGLVNTADDNPALPDSIVDPGPDGILGTADDIIIPLNNYTREIRITDLTDSLRRIDVIMRYQVGRLGRQYTLTTYISSFS